MPRFPQRITLVLALTVCAQYSSQAAEQGTDASSPGAVSDVQESGISNHAIKEWFKKYDQIRQGAEMTLGDKLQCLRLASGRLGVGFKSTALASRMKSKYANALIEMKKLTRAPETTELQDGYIEYFRKGTQLISDYIDAQEKDPHNRTSLLSVKKELEELDKQNKCLDEKLRSQYSIAKHKHI